MFDYVVKSWDAFDEEMRPGIDKCLSLVAIRQRAAGGSAYREEGVGIRCQMWLGCIRRQPVDELTVAIKHGIRSGKATDAPLLL